MLPTESMEGEVAKKDQEQRIKYYESARELTLAMMQKAEDALQQLKEFGDDFSGIFAKTAQRHHSLLNKIDKLVERDRKKYGGAAKVDMKKVKKVMKVEGAKPLTSKPKPPASKAKFREPAGGPLVKRKVSVGLSTGLNQPQ